SYLFGLLWYVRKARAHTRGLKETRIPLSLHDRARRCSKAPSLNENDPYARRARAVMPLPLKAKDRLQRFSLLRVLYGLVDLLERVGPYHSLEGKASRFVKVQELRYEDA